MIKDSRVTIIKGSKEEIFDLIDRMPTKFPIYNILESKPFFFLRILLFDGIHSAKKAMKLNRPTSEFRLSINDKMGPFTLSVFDRPNKYWFSLESLFFNCLTGYTLSSVQGGTELCFDIISENPSFKEKVWWLVFKPFHILFAKKSLNVIKRMVEQNHSTD